LINIITEVYSFCIVLSINYFFLARNNIQHASVQHILDSVIISLDQNSDRRFIYVEIAYFWRWWNEQTDDIRNKVKQFVNDGKKYFN
jgi:lysosomal alpha-mannosidase